MFDLGIGKWMGDTNIESDDTEFLHSIVFDHNLSDETGPERSIALVETSVKETRVVMSSGDETLQETKRPDKENIPVIQGDVANYSDISLQESENALV